MQAISFLFLLAILIAQQKQNRHFYFRNEPGYKFRSQVTLPLICDFLSQRRSPIKFKMAAVCDGCDEYGRGLDNILSFCSLS